MKLVVLGGGNNFFLLYDLQKYSKIIIIESLEILEREVASKFSDIPNRFISPAVYRESSLRSESLKVIQHV